MPRDLPAASIAQRHQIETISVPVTLGTAAGQAVSVTNSNGWISRLQHPLPQSMLPVTAGPENNHSVVAYGWEGHSMRCIKLAPAQSLCNTGRQNRFVLGQ